MKNLKMKSRFDLQQINFNFEMYLLAQEFKKFT